MGEARKAFIFVIAMLASVGFAGLLLLVFLMLSDEVIEKEIDIFDRLMMKLILSIKSPFLDIVMKTATELGSWWFITLLSLLALLILWTRYKDKWAIFFLIWTVGGGGLLNLFLKNLFERDRPPGDAMVSSDGFSFPSGHVMMSLIMYGFFIYLIVRLAPKKMGTIVSAVFLVIVIAGVGYSRVYLEVHYPSDVLSGLLGGAIWLIVSLMAFEWVRWKQQHKKTAITFMKESVRIYKKIRNKQH